MVRRAVPCLILLALAACGRVETGPVAGSTAAPAIVSPVVDPEPALFTPPPAPEPLIPNEAINLIVSFEVGSPELYERRYKAPIWPGAASGPTWGIGYDGGHRRADIILVDWESHPHAARLATAAGITGPISREWVRKAADISVEYGMARHVFDQTSLVEHYRIARRVFGESFAATCRQVTQHQQAGHGDAANDQQRPRLIVWPGGNQ